MADLPLLFGIVAAAGHGNRGDGEFKLPPLRRGTDKIKRMKVFLQMRQLGRSGNRHDPRSFPQQPAQRDLRRSHAAYSPELLQNIHDPGIGANRRRSETRKRLTVVVVGIELRVFVDSAAEKAAVERTVRNEADAEFAAHVKHAVSFHVAVHQMIFALNGGQRLNRMCPADGFGADFAHSPPQDFAFSDQFADGSGNLNAKEQPSKTSDDPLGDILNDYE